MNRPYPLEPIPEEGENGGRPSPPLNGPGVPMPGQQIPGQQRGTQGPEQLGPQGGEAIA